MKHPKTAAARVDARAFIEHREYHDPDLAFNTSG
jgi:hypothetical protein